jgi:regulatory protein
MIDDQERAPGDGYPQALQTALRYISFKPRTVSEVRKRVGRDFAQPVVEQVLSSLKRYGYLDDAEYARQWRASRERRKPRGEFLLRRELRGKGVAEDTIDDALKGLDQASSAYRAGQRRAERSLMGHEMSYREFQRKMWDYLRRRGFPTGVIRETANRLWLEYTP